MAAASPVIRVFEPALCCNTGVCGPDVDQALVTFTADLEHLQGLGVDIQRHNLANDPGAFAADTAVRDFLRVAGSAGLPLTLVDGITAMTGAYPSRDRLLHLAGRPVEAPASMAHRDLGLSAVSSDGCCGGGAAAAEESAASSCCGGGTAAAEEPAASSCCGGNATAAAGVGTTASGACC